MLGIIDITGEKIGCQRIGELTIRIGAECAEKPVVCRKSRLLISSVSAAVDRLSQ
jgi:hypothetical protein